MRLLLAALFCVGLVGIAPDAQATPGPPCVSRAEFRRLSDYEERRKAVEEFWGVRGDGRPERNTTNAIVIPNTHVVKYRSCGFRPAEGWVDVYYTNNTRELDTVTIRWAIHSSPTERVAVPN